jgi:hypothetical protein
MWSRVGYDLAFLRYAISAIDEQLKLIIEVEKLMETRMRNIFRLFFADCFQSVLIKDIQLVGIVRSLES